MQQWRQAAVAASGGGSSGRRPDGDHAAALHAWRFWHPPPAQGSVQSVQGRSQDEWRTRRLALPLVGGPLAAQHSLLTMLQLHAAPGRRARAQAGVQRNRCWLAAALVRADAAPHAL
jgi:hypothetical protein